MFNSITQPRMKKEIEESYSSILAPFATHRPKENSRKIEKKNVDTDNRASFQRDRDRIIHSRAFRRLMYKTQVFVNHEGDHFRTRLTHTLEVSQFARGICKCLALNEDLAEAISLGHDLGHTPFGHAVERYLDSKIKENNLGRFYHNEQSVRVVDFLENREVGTDGLNLTHEVREGIFKHTKDNSGIYADLMPDFPCSSLEGQIVGIVDTMAYLCHDLEDGIKSGVLQYSIQNNKDSLHKYHELSELVQKYTGVKICSEQYSGSFFIRDLIHQLIEKLTRDSWDNIILKGVKTLEDVQEYAKKKERIITFNEENSAFFASFKELISALVYDTQMIHTMDRKAIKLAETLYESYLDKPKLLPPKWLYKYNNIKEFKEYDDKSNDKSNGHIWLICDYISSMTDRYAIEEKERISNPAIKI